MPRGKGQPGRMSVMLKPAAETANVVATVMMDAISAYSTGLMPLSSSNSFRSKRNTIGLLNTLVRRKMPYQI